LEAGGSFQWRVMHKIVFKIYAKRKGLIDHVEHMRLIISLGGLKKFILRLNVKFVLEVLQAVLKLKRLQIYYIHVHFWR
jgi:hypothetical protein